MAVANERLQPAYLGELDDDEPFEGLTPKQAQFCRAVFTGLSYSEAYRRIYDVAGLSEQAVRINASKAANEPNVKLKLRQLRITADNQATLAPLLNADWVINGIRDLAVNADSDSVRLAAYVHLGKTRELNIFGKDESDKKVKARSPEDVERELRDLLARLQPSIEGTARDVTPAEESPPPRRQRKPRR